MKDRSSWTDEQINEAVAIKKGWHRYTRHDESGLWDTWITPRNTPSIYNQIPKYTHDWKLCGELLAEIPNCCLRRWGDKWCCGFYDDNGYLMNQANVYDSPLRAICEEWLEWEEEK